MAPVVDVLARYPAFPTLWVPHCVIMSLALRTTLDPTRWRAFSRRHPLSCLMLDVLYVYSGAIFSTLLLAEPSLAQVFLNTQPLLVSLVCWYLVFYCPGDLFVRCLDAMHLRIPLAAMQDFLRIQLVRSGVDIILKEHPGTFVYPVVFSICKSSGFLFLKYAERLLKEPGASGAFVIPNVATKLCVLSSLLFTAQQNGVLSVEKDVLFAGAVIVAVVLRLFSALSSADPFALAEDFSCGLLFGRHHDDGREVTEVKKKRN